MTFLRRARRTAFRQDWRIVHDAPDSVQDRFFELVVRRG